MNKIEQVKERAKTDKQFKKRLERGAIINTQRDECRQEHEQAHNINNICKQISKGIVPQNQREGQYLDTTNLPSYQESLDRINQAQIAFNSLDIRVQERFNHDPQRS